jgi:VIT1/CCC1 family predicted Fe2+/Mn2+ transporter
MPKSHTETHKIHNIGWLRAAVLGANDGIVSTASLVLGVAASGADHSNILVAGFAGLAAGAMAMATGEYVSVSSQKDTEKAALDKEVSELEEDFSSEHAELAAIYVRRGLDLTLANEVAEKLMAHDALGAHTLDELGISEMTSARPLQAAIASAGCFAVGASLPLGIVLLAPAQNLIIIVAGGALVLLAALGALAAKVGGARIFPAVVRVTFWSALALAVTFGVGALFGMKG